MRFGFDAHFHDQLLLVQRIGAFDGGPNLLLRHVLLLFFFNRLGGLLGRAVLDLHQALPLPVLVPLPLRLHLHLDRLLLLLLLLLDLLDLLDLPMRLDLRQRLLRLLLPLLGLLLRLLGLLLRDHSQLLLGCRQNAGRSSRATQGVLQPQDTLKALPPHSSELLRDGLVV